MQPLWYKQSDLKSIYHFQLVYKVLKRSLTDIIVLFFFLLREICTVDVELYVYSVDLSKISHVHEIILRSHF